MMKINKETGFAHLLVIVLLAVVVVSGSGYYVYSKNHKDVKSSATPATSTVLAKPLPDDLLTTTEVQSLAEKQQPSKAIQGIELDTQGDTLVFRVKLADNSFLLFNAKSGVLISKGNTTEIEAGLDQLPDSLKTAVSFDQARTIALAQKPGGIIRMLKLEKEAGVVVFSVRFTDGSKVDINATTGAIVKTTGKTENKADTEKSENETETETHKKSSTTKPETEQEASTATTNTNSGSGSDSSGGGGGHGSDN